jgi:hypothetical protein
MNTEDFDELAHRHAPDCPTAQARALAKAVHDVAAADVKRLQHERDSAMRQWQIITDQMVMRTEQRDQLTVDLERLRAQVAPAGWWITQTDRSGAVKRWAVTESQLLAIGLDAPAQQANPLDLRDDVIETLKYHLAQERALCDERGRRLDEQGEELEQLHAQVAQERATWAERDDIHTESSRIYARLAGAVRSGADETTLARLLRDEVRQRTAPAQQARSTRSPDASKSGAGFDMSAQQTGFAAQLTGRAMRIAPASPKRQVVYLYTATPLQPAAQAEPASSSGSSQAAPVVAPTDREATADDGVVTLPPLPEARWTWRTGDRPYEDSYSISQMQDYARAARAQAPSTDGVDLPTTQAGWLHRCDMRFAEGYAKGRQSAQAPAAEPQWLPIETAPKDGRDLLLWEAGSFVPFVGAWRDGRRPGWHCDTEHYDTDGNACVVSKLWQEGVTHWMPLPAAPAAAKEQP